MLITLLLKKVVCELVLGTFCLIKDLTKKEFENFIYILSCLYLNIKIKRIKENIKYVAIFEQKELHLFFVYLCSFYFKKFHARRLEFYMK